MLFITVGLSISCSHFWQFVFLYYRRCVTGAMVRLPCCEHTYAATRPTRPATSVKSAVARSCIAAIWKFTLPFTPPNVPSPAAPAGSLSRLLPPSILTRLSTSLRPSPVTCARNAESRSKPSSDCVLTSSDIRGLNPMPVGAVAALFQIEADLQSMCEQSTQHVRGMPAHRAGRLPTVLTTCGSICGPTEIQSS